MNPYASAADAALALDLHARLGAVLARLHPPPPVDDLAQLAALGGAPTLHQCPRCLEHKPAEAFGMRGDRRQSWCKRCRSRRGTELERAKRTATTATPKE